MPVARDLPAEGIQPHSAGFQDGAARRLTAPLQSAQPDHELRELEGLDEVVIRPEFEALDAFAQGAGRGEHEDAHLRVLAGQAVADLVAVDTGQVPVQNDDIVVGDLHLGQRFGAVPHDVHRHRLATQPHGYRIGEIGLVLDHQYAHVIDLPGFRFLQPSAFPSRSHGPFQGARRRPPTRQR